MSSLFLWHLFLAALVAHEKKLLADMGNWQLEVFKMTIYLAFPVGLFHVFNQPQYFEEWVTSIKRELFPSENKNNSTMLQETILEMRRKANEEILAAIEASERERSNTSQ